MNNDLPLPPKPPLTLLIGERELKMTYGLEMDIRRMLPDPMTALTMMRDDPFTQDYVVRRALTPIKRMVNDVSELVDMDELEIESEHVEDILTWATEHALYFFVKRTLAMAKLGVQYQQALPTPTPDGSEDSALKTPSAGPSAA